MIKDTKVRRGDVFFAELNGGIGSEQKGIRPVLVVQNNLGNENSGTTIVVPISTRRHDKNLPVHCKVKCTGLQNNSVAFLEQIRVIDKQRLLNKIGSVPKEILKDINQALTISVGLY